MSLLDGKYEIIAQRDLSSDQTLFEATAPDGTLLHIIWYHLAPSQEQGFEHYRRTLKKLKRSGHAAIFDIVSRPGANYIAWLPPNGSEPQAPPDSSLVAALESQGYGAEDANILRSGSHPLIFGLAFDGTLPIPRETPTSTTIESPPPSSATGPNTLPIWTLSWALTVAMIIIALASFSLGFHRRANDRTVMVPNVLERNIRDAAKLLTRLGLQVEPAALSSEQAAGTVLKLEPPAGTQLRPGRPVRLAYALPPGQLAPTTVPQLIGLQYPDEVATTLEAAGLELGRVARVAADVPANIVIAQDIPANETLGRGSTVDILLSAGPQQALTFLPDLVGLTLDDARFLARTAGISPDHIRVDTVAGDAGTAGKVIGQSLTPYLLISRDEAVLRLITTQGESRPTSSTGVPYLVGMSAEQARAAATGYQIVVSVLEQPSLPEGVVSQTPPPGDPASAGTLSLLINVHPVTIPVPRVQVTIKQPTFRRLEYAWIIQPGIPERTAEVFATTLGGSTVQVARRTVRGGDLLKGDWFSRTVGPVTFTVTLDGVPYGETLVVNP